MRTLLQQNTMWAWVAAIIGLILIHQAGLNPLTLLSGILFNPVSVLCIAVTALAIIGYGSGRRVSLAAGRGSADELVSLPSYHGMFVAFCVLLPALATLIVWVALEPIVIRWLVMAPLESLMIVRSEAQIDLLYSRITGVGVTGLGTSIRDQSLLDAAVSNYASLQQTSRNLMLAGTLAVAGLGGYLALRRIAVDFRARERVEAITKGLMIICAVVAILTTLGIVFALVGESVLFFSQVPIFDFLFGLRWSPQEAIRADQAGSSGAFGALPLLLGTAIIGLIALLVAVPLGLLSAIYLAEYATARVRNTLKPVLEILAGIPTVVYGFFAILVIAPLFPPIEAGWSRMMDGAITRLFEARLEVATAGQAQDGVPITLPSGVILVRADNLDDTIARLSTQDRAHILDEGVDGFEVFVTADNANSVAGLLPIEQRTDHLVRLGALNTRLREIEGRFADLINNDGRFEDLLSDAPAGISDSDRRDRAQQDLRRGQMITAVTNLIGIADPDDREAAIADLLSRLQLDRVDPFRIAEARLLGLEPDQQEALQRRSRGLEEGEAIALEGLVQQRLLDEPNLTEEQAAPLARDALTVMDLVPEERPARIADVTDRYRDALATNIATAARADIAAELEVASRELMGVDEAALERIDNQIRALVSMAERRERQALHSDLLAGLEDTGVPLEAREDIEEILDQLEARFALIDREARQAREAFLDQMGRSARDLRDQLEAVELDRRTSGRAEAAEATIEALNKRLSDAATERLLTLGEQDALLNRITDYPKREGSERERVLREINGRLDALAELSAEHRTVIDASLAELQTVVARGDAAAVRLETDLNDLVTRFEADLTSLQNDIDAASPETREQAVDQLLLAHFTADYQRLYEDRQALFAEIEAEARALHPTPEEVDPSFGYNWRSLFFWIFGITFIGASANSAMAAGLVMGVMIIPLVTSLSDDVISAVPQTLRDGSDALGATPSETTKRVVLPAALPGIVGAVLLAASRAIGETMIVVMAAGIAAPNLTEDPVSAFNPFAALTTVTVQIATLLVGDQEFDSAKTLSVFALGLLLFVLTLALNLLSLRIVKKYREQYD